MNAFIPPVRDVNGGRERGAGSRESEPRIGTERNPANCTS